MGNKGKRVLNVKLQLVVFEIRELIDQLFESGQCGYLAATDVDHDASMGEVRLIGDLAVVELASRLPEQLAERREPSEGACLVTCSDIDALRTDGNGVGIN